MTEVERKLLQLREVLQLHDLQALRLRGVDWFSWATGGASSVVILTAEKGIAEILVTRSGAWILTDKIEAPRLQAEEINSVFEFQVHDWFDLPARAAFVKSIVGPSARVASDYPQGEEQKLPPGCERIRRSLGAEEITRYRQVGAEASAAISPVLMRAMPDWTEFDLAAQAAAALWQRGLHPTLTLVAGAGRLEKFRHPVPTAAPLGPAAMLVVCARRHGLYANFTRFVYFKNPPAEIVQRHRDVAAIESAALSASRVGATLGQVLQALATAYQAHGYTEELGQHHQGGTTGYLSRESVATFGHPEVLQNHTALAWNPSLRGVKIEDTFLLGDAGLENLTGDPHWPQHEVSGRARPAVYIKDVL